MKPARRAWSVVPCMVLWLVSAGLVTQTPLERIPHAGREPETLGRGFTYHGRTDVAQGEALLLRHVVQECGGG